MSGMSSRSSRSATRGSTPHESPLDKQKGVRGIQYAAEAYRSTHARSEITPTMSRKGDSLGEAGKINERPTLR